MKSSKLTKSKVPDILFISIIVVFAFIYFIIYMTPSRTAWYREMRNQLIIYYNELTSIGS